MLRSFFIDLENVRSYGLEGILLLKPEDKVYVFYSDNANTLTIPTIESLNESSAQVKYIKTNNIGANAMDFQIVTLLGASIEKEHEGRFYIISHDNGFKSAVKFCEGYFTGYNIVTGVFANILLAINSEKGGVAVKAASEDKKDHRKKSDKNGSSRNEQSSEDTKERKKEEPLKNTEDIITGTESTDNVQKTEGSGRNRRRRRRSGQKSEDAKRPETVADENSVNNPEKDAASDGEKVKPVVEKGSNRKDGGNNHRKKIQKNEVMPAEDKQDNVAEQGAEPEKDVIKSGNRRRRSRGKDRNAVKNTEKTVDNTDVKNPVSPEKKDVKAPVNTGNYKYVYNALSDFLSKKTIDMYASKIDEGIRKSVNRNELHEFFKKSYGKDEAEALYKIICSDFEKMKKEAGK